jgi:hypothetical protein
MYHPALGGHSPEWESDEHQATDLARRPHLVERLNMIAPDDVV